MSCFSATVLARSLVCAILITEKIPQIQSYRLRAHIISIGIAYDGIVSPLEASIINTVRYYQKQNHGKYYTPIYIIIFLCGITVPLSFYLTSPAPNGSINEVFNDILCKYVVVFMCCFGIGAFTVLWQNILLLGEYGVIGNIKNLKRNCASKCSKIFRKCVIFFQDIRGKCVNCKSRFTNKVSDDPNASYGFENFDSRMGSRIAWHGLSREDKIIHKKPQDELRLGDWQIFPQFTGSRRNVDVDEFELPMSCPNISAQKIRKNKKETVKGIQDLKSFKCTANKIKNVNKIKSKEKWLNKNINESISMDNESINPTSITEKPSGPSKAQNNDVNYNSDVDVTKDIEKEDLVENRYRHCAKKRIRKNNKKNHSTRKSNRNIIGRETTLDIYISDDSNETLKENYKKSKSLRHSAKETTTMDQQMYELPKSNDLVHTSKSSNPTLKSTSNDLDTTNRNINESSNAEITNQRNDTKGFLIICDGHERASKGENELAENDKITIASSENINSASDRNKLQRKEILFKINKKQKIITKKVDDRHLKNETNTNLAFRVGDTKENVAGAMSQPFDMAISETNEKIKNDLKISREKFDVKAEIESTYERLNQTVMEVMNLSKTNNESENDIPINVPPLDIPKASHDEFTDIENTNDRISLEKNWKSFEFSPSSSSPMSSSSPRSECMSSGPSLTTPPNSPHISSEFFSIPPYLRKSIEHIFNSRKLGSVEEESDSSSHQDIKASKCSNSEGKSIVKIGSTRNILRSSSFSLVCEIKENRVTYGMTIAYLGLYFPLVILLLCIEYLPDHKDGLICSFLWLIMAALSSSVFPFVYGFRDPLILNDVCSLRLC